MKHAISSKKLDIAVLILLCLSAAALLRQSLLPSHTLLPLDLIYTIAPWHDPDAAPLQNSLLSDPFYSFYPRRVLLTESIRNGELPLWNPTIMAGTPNIANPNFQLFYPPNLLAALILPADQSLPWLAWVHLVMAGGLMYLFLKRHKLAIGACALGAVVWMLNGYTLVWLENPHRLSTTAWITAVFWAFETAVQRKNPAWAAGGGLFLGMSILGGQVQFIFAVGVIFGLYGLMILIDALWKKQRANAVQILGYMAVVGIIGLGIGSLLLIPAMEFAQISQRVTFNADSILNTRWQPTHLITLLAPDLYGNPIKQGYWGKANYAEMTAYFGVVALILGITAPAVARKTRFAVQTYVISMVVLLLVLGTWLARLLFLIPGAQFLSLNRLLFLVPFAGTWLAAIALDGWWQGVSKRQTAVSLTSVIILLTSLFIWTQRSLGEQFTQHQSSIWPDVVRGGGIATAVTILLLLIKKWPLPVMTLLIIIACVDLLQWGWAFNPITPVTMLYPENELTTFLEQDDGLHRVLALQSGKVLFGPNVLSLYNKQTIGGYTPLIPKNYQQLYKSIDDQVEISWMAPNRNMLVMSHFNPAVSLLNVKYVLSVNPLNVDIVPQGSQLGCNEQIAIPTTQTISIADAGFNRLDLFFASLPTHSDEKVDISIRHNDTNGRLFMQTTLDANTIPTDREQALFFAPIADSAGQTYVIDITSSSDEVALCGGAGEDGRFTPSYAAYATWLKAHEPVNDIWIYENRNVLPRAFMVHHVVQQDEADVLETLHSADFNWHHSAIMTDSLPAAHQAQLSDKPIRTDSQVVIQNYQGQTIDIFVETPTAGMVVLSDTYYPGWKATVDGKPTPIHQVDHTLRGIFVPPGAHQIQFTFQSNSLKIATFIAIISLLITAGIIGKQSLPKVRNQDDARTTFMA